MDISKASNFERFIFDLMQGDAKRVRELFHKVETQGGFDLSGKPGSDGDEFKQVEKYGFKSGKSTHADRVQTIRDVADDYGIVIDTHTADGIKVAREFMEPGVPMIVLETALAAKFNETILEALGHVMPIKLSDITLADKGVGLVIVDEVNGFATVGAGYLAPPVENEQVTRMVQETDRLAREFTKRRWPIFAFLDTHVPGKAEPPYPPHCEAGTGEEHLVLQVHERLHGYKAEEPAFGADEGDIVVKFLFLPGRDDGEERWSETDGGTRLACPRAPAPGEHTDGCSFRKEVQNHLVGNFPGIGTDAFSRDAMIGCKNIDSFGNRIRKTLLTD